MNKMLEVIKNLQERNIQLVEANKKQAKTIKIILDLLDDVGICVLVDHESCPDCSNRHAVLCPLVKDCLSEWLEGKV